MSVKKKICFIAQFPPPIHGLSKAVDTLFNSELRNEFDFEKIDIKDNRQILKNLNRIRKSDADLFYFTISQSRGGNIRDLVVLKLLSLQHKRCLIHLHGGYYRKLVDEALPRWQRKANYKAISKIDGAIVLGESLKWIFQGMLPADKIHVVPNCVDDEYLMSDEDFNKKIHDIEKHEIKHVLYLSNFIKEKGYPEVLEMAKMEKERVKNGGERRFHFDFAGKFFDKKEKDFFDAYVSDNEIEDYITYHGVVSGKQKKELLKKSDIFCLLTTYQKEGQPISILEAMANGCVVMSTDYAGIPDIVSDENGIIINSSISNLTQKAYEKLFFIEYVKMDIASRELIKRNFCQPRYLNNIRNVFTLLGAK